VATKQPIPIIESLLIVAGAGLIIASIAMAIVKFAKSRLE
jgi:hypothetical protein